MRKVWLLALIVAGLLAGMAATRWLTLPPPVRAANPAGEFDVGRAKARWARVLGNEAPHPADSAASDVVRTVSGSSRPTRRATARQRASCCCDRP